jgi:antitoxin PrlF
MLATSKLTAKAQTTVPRQVREHLGLEPGDSLAYELDAGGAVRLRKLPPVDVAYLRAVQATLSPEWDSPEDDAAYADL